MPMDQDGPVPDWVENTQKTLGSLIDKPKLTSKYLTRPPFRFLHDIVVEVVKSTALGQTAQQHQLFSEDEMDATKAGADKNSKVAFLHKVISLVYFCIPAEQGDLLSTISPAKIVAGLEAEKTNFFLQMLYEAATASFGGISDAAVKRVMAGESFEEPRRLVTANKPVKPNTPKQLRPPTTPFSLASKSEEDPFPPPPPDAPSLAAPTPRLVESPANSPPPVGRPSSRRGDVPEEESGMRTRAPVAQPTRPMTAQKRPPRDPPAEPIASEYTNVAAPIVVADGDIADRPSEISMDEQSSSAAVFDVSGDAFNPAVDTSGGIRMTRSKAKLSKGAAAIRPPAGAVDTKAVQTSLQNLVDEAQAFAKAHEGVAHDTAGFSREIEETKAEIARLDKRLMAEQKATDESLQPLRRTLAEIADARKDVAQELAQVKERILLKEARIRDSLESIVTSRA